jgi:hypothetical protein
VPPGVVEECFCGVLGDAFRSPQHGHRAGIPLAVVLWRLGQCKEGIDRPVGDLTQEFSAGFGVCAASFGVVSHTAGQGPSSPIKRCAIRSRNSPRRPRICWEVRGLLRRMQLLKYT